MNDGRYLLPLATVVLYAAGVFVLDLLTPGQFEVWLLYLPVILLGVWFNDRGLVLVTGVACSTLMVVGLLLSTQERPISSAWENMFLGLMALWLMTFAGATIAWRSVQLADTMASLEREIAQHRQTERARAEGLEQVRRLEHELLKIATREQQRIGQELHDGVGQELTGLGLMADALAQRLQGTTTEEQIAARLVAGLERAHRHVRELSRGLVPVQVEAKGLCAALDDLASGMSEQSGAAVTFDPLNWVEVPDNTTATHLFRIAQEAVSNALRHGHARQVCLSLFSGPDGLELRIWDDGSGLPARFEEGEGMGLRIMRYRAEQVGGVLRVGPCEDGGTVVTCTVPGRASHAGEDRGDVPGGRADPDRG